jgi:hypothetical protein
LRIGASDNQTPRGFRIFPNSKCWDFLQAIVKNTRRAFSRENYADRQTTRPVRSCMS